MLSSRLLTDAGIPGVERLAASCIRPEFGLAPRFLLSTSAIRSDLSHMLAPMNVLFVKGWTRSLAAFTVLLAAYETSDSSSSDSAAPSLMEAGVRVVIIQYLNINLGISSLSIDCLVWVGRNT